MNDDTRILIQMLEGTAGWDALVDHLNEHRRSLISQILTGYQNPDEYHRMCGEVKGIDLILTAPSHPDAKRPASRTPISRH